MGSPLIHPGWIHWFGKGIGFFSTSSPVFWWIFMMEIVKTNRFVQEMMGLELKPLESGNFR